MDLLQSWAVPPFAKIRTSCINKQRIKITLFFSLLSEFANKIFPLIVLSYVASKLGVEKFGFAQFCIYLIDFTFPLILLGYINWGALTVGTAEKEDDAHQAFWSIFRLKMIQAVIVTTILLVFLASNAHYRQYFEPVLFLAFAPIALAFDATYFLVARQKIPVFSIISIICKLFGLFATLLFVNDAEHAIRFAVITLATNSCISIGSFIYVRRKFVPPQSKLKSTIKLLPVIKSSASFSLLLVLMYILDHYEVFLIQHHSGEYGLGLFSAAQKISLSIFALIAVVYTVFHSESLGARDSKKLAEHIMLSTKILTWFIIPISFGTYFVGSDLLGLLIGQDFASAGRIFFWQNLGLLPQGLLITYGSSFLIIKGYIKAVNLLYTLMLLLALGLSVYLMSFWGIEGIIWGALFAKIIGLGILVVFVKRLGLIFEIIDFIGPIICSILMSLTFVYLLQDLHLVLQISIAGLVYVISAYFLFRKHLIKRPSN